MDLENSSENSSIERLKKTLYSRNDAIVPKEKRTPVEGYENNVPTSWGTPRSFSVSTDQMAKKNNSFFNKFLLGSLVFFVISLGIALFIFFGGINMISSNNLDINITAPSSVSSGEEFDMGLNIINGNRTDLEGVSLYIDYPDGSESVGDVNKVLAHDKIDLDTIPKGGSKDYDVRALLFGEKDAVKTFTLRIEYMVKGSNAVFSKQKTYDVSIGSSPLLLDVTYPKEVNSGQTVQLSIDITSNSSVVLSNSLVKVEYPYGFTYTSSNIKPLPGNSVWNIGDLKNGDKKNLTITGVLVGQNMEDRSFRITTGTKSSDPSKDFDTTLAEYLATVGLRKSFFDLTVTPAGDAAVARAGDMIPIGISWQNTLPDKIENSHIEATISGNAFDRNSVTPSNNGFYRSIDNTVVWDKNNVGDLAEILPGAGGQVSFSPTAFSSSALPRTTKNPHIDVHIVMTGDRTGTDAGSVSSTIDTTIKIRSDMTLTSKSLRNTGGFTNTGPIPPKADTESTYTIDWTLTNTTNDLKDTLVTATLPVGVEWKSAVLPADEKISYDADTRTVTWNVGNISAGAGYTSGAKEASFQVGITPSINQIGSLPPLTSQVTAAATDTYTSQSIQTSAQSVSTQFAEPNYAFGMGEVVQ